MPSSKDKQFGRFYDNPLKKDGREAEHDRSDAAHFDEEASTFIQRLGEDALRVHTDEPMSARHKAFWDVVGDVRGRRVLDVGTGAGWCACMLALRGAEVVAIDVSGGMCDLARQAARLNGVEVGVRQISAVDTGFADGHFDVVVGQLSFHHMPYPKAARELHRVLKPQGRAVFLDPIHGSRFYVFLRGLLPIHCHESDGGGALRRDQILSLGELFGDVQVRWFGPMARLDRFDFLEPVYPVMAAVDRALLRLPGSGWLASYAVIEYRKTSRARREQNGRSHHP